MPPSQQIRHKTLSAYHPRLHLLAVYLEACPVAETLTREDLVRPTDPVEYVQLLQGTICAPRDESAQLPQLQKVQRGVGPEHKLVVEGVLDELGKRGGVSGDALLLGLSTRAESDLPINPARPHFENRHIDSPSSLLSTQAWKILRTRIGNTAFRFLLLKTALYLPVGNNCYVQLSGAPVHEQYKHASVLNTVKSVDTRRIGKRSGSDQAPRRVKRRKTASKSGTADTSTSSASSSSADIGAQCIRSLGTARTVSSSSPAERQILRGRMFYGRPCRNGKGKIEYGLPTHHPLTRLNPTRSSPSDTQCLALLRIALPRLFADASSVAIADLRIHHLAPPKRHTKPAARTRTLEPLVSFFRELWARHLRFDYAAAVRRCAERAHADATMGGGSQDALRAVSADNVSRFVGTWMRGVIGVDMVGEPNLDVLVRHAKTSVCMKQYEPVTLHALMQGVQTTLFRCYTSPLPGQRVSQAEHAKRRAIVEDIVFWLFSDVLIPLLKNTFYITETAATRYETVYYLHADWARAAEPHLETLQAELLEPLSDYDAFLARQGPLGVSSVRLVPKPNGFRPIVNLGKSVNGAGGTTTAARGVTNRTKAMSANQILRNVHQVLTFEKDRHRAGLGNTLFGTNEVFAPLRSLKRELLAAHGMIPQLYFAKMDIKAAFDTIDQTKMLEVIERQLDRNHDYCIMMYALLLPPASAASQGSARRLFKTKAVSGADASPVFGTHARGIAEPLRNAVVVDLMRRKRVSAADVMGLLRVHIANNVWQIGNKLYRQKTGIPQGSKISSLLCSIFYAALEVEHLGFVNAPGTKLLRYIDDFLLVTDSRARAERFVVRMNEGFAAYGAHVAQSKTLLSFEMSSGRAGSGARVEPVCLGAGAGGSAYFPYCGFLIDMRSLDVSMDYTRALNTHIQQTFSLRSARKRGAGFVGWFSRQLENRNHVAYLDTRHNDARTAKLNVVLNFALTGMKVPHYFGAAGVAGSGSGSGSAAPQSRAVARERKGRLAKNRARMFSMSESRARMICDALCAAVEYTFVAGRARVMHSARKDAKLGSAGTMRAPGSERVDRDQGADANSDDEMAVDVDGVTRADISVGAHYAIRRDEFTFLALSAIRLALRAKGPAFGRVVMLLEERLRARALRAGAGDGARFGAGVVGTVGSGSGSGSGAGAGAVTPTPTQGRRELEEVLRAGWEALGGVRF